MIHQVWQLSEPGEDNLGLAITPDGLVLGHTPLLERRDGSFVVRERREIQRLLSCAYRRGVAVERLMSGLATVASALNANDPCLARIAAVHLRIPDLPNKSARDAMAAEDIFIKSADRKSAPQWREIRKASPDDPKHPGWPAGTPGGLGGKFRPKGSTAALTERIKELITREQLRMNLTATLHVGIEALANLIPGLDVAADVAMVAEIARSMSEYRKLAIAAAAAFKFVQDAPYSLEDLQVSDDYMEFSNYDAFVKNRLNSKFMLKFFDSAGDGSQYHHIVTQGGANVDNIPAAQLQNTDNIVILPTLLHEMVNDEYLGPAPDGSSMTLYQWLQTQSYEVQREYGLQILRDLRILK
jgi:hypothetical protein